MWSGLGRVDAGLNDQIAGRAKQDEVLGSIATYQGKTPFRIDRCDFDHLDANTRLLGALDARNIVSGDAELVRALLFRASEDQVQSVRSAAISRPERVRGKSTAVKPFTSGIATVTSSTILT